MQKHLQLTIPGEPVGQGRPRFSTANGKMRTFDPAKSRDYKALVSMIATKAMKEQGWEYTDQPVMVQIDAFISVPESLSKTAKVECYAWQRQPCKKPDLDNVAKIICDAMNGIVYRDDSQVCTLWAARRYVSGPSVAPYIEVKISVDDHVRRQ